MDTNTIVTDLKPTIDVHICLPIKNTHLATTAFVYALYNVNSCIQGSEKKSTIACKMNFCFIHLDMNRNNYSFIGS